MGYSNHGDYGHTTIAAGVTGTRGRETDDAEFYYRPTSLEKRTSAAEAVKQSMSLRHGAEAVGPSSESTPHPRKGSEGSQC